MSSIRSYDTLPERMVRSVLHRMGYRFRIRRSQLPGNPDIVLTRYKGLSSFIECFWHGHKNCRRSKRPDANATFWAHKLDNNIARDIRQQKELKGLGWKTLIIWQCQIRDHTKLRNKIAHFMNDTRT